MKPASEMMPDRWATSWVIAVLVLAMMVPSVAQTRTRRLVLVSIADRKLAVIEDGKVLAYFLVGVGAAVSPSPTGEFEIVNRVANPAYYHDGTVMEASENSPVGTRWMGLNLKGYGIHGTDAPRSIGRVRRMDASG
jgi:lipoprotein-anchoring transpeptidase ErfK/SrfK